MAKIEKDNRQIIEHKTQHRKLKTKQHESHQKQGVISGALEGIQNRSTCGTRRVAHVITNLLNSLIW